jgi:glutamate N-acetyltransferase/amino-acid N-acetyltransferase
MIKVPGFLFSALSGGIKKKPDLDMGLIFSKKEAAMAGVFTINLIKAAPVRECIKKIGSAKGQAIVVNSGNANACTGTQGIQDVQTTASLLAKQFGINESLVYVASTGVIGEPLPMNKITAALPKLVDKLSDESIHEVASAIMTTDTFPKLYYRTINIKNYVGTLAGLAKGSGMIEPDMATMLCFLMTDLAVEPTALQTALRSAVDQSFNRITVDGDMSTNDTALVMANGFLQNLPICIDSKEYGLFYEAMADVTCQLARMIAKDGEGATRLIEVSVKGAKNDMEANLAARAIANSNLVKTAIYGQDANWGRIMAAIGYSGAEAEESKSNIFINNIQIAKSGLATGKDAEAGASLSQKEVTIVVDLGIGTGQGRILTCDLTEDYIRINALYRS